MPGMGSSICFFMFPGSKKQIVPGLFLASVQNTRCAVVKSRITVVVAELEPVSVNFTAKQSGFRIGGWSGFHGFRASEGRTLAVVRSREYRAQLPGGKSGRDHRGNHCRPA